MLDVGGTAAFLLGNCVQRQSRQMTVLCKRDEDLLKPVYFYFPSILGATYFRDLQRYYKIM